MHTRTRRNFTVSHAGAGAPVGWAIKERLRFCRPNGAEHPAATPRSTANPSGNQRQPSRREGHSRVVKVPGGRRLSRKRGLGLLRVSPRR